MNSASPNITNMSYLELVDYLKSNMTPQVRKTVLDRLVEINGNLLLREQDEVLDAMLERFNIRYQRVMAIKKAKKAESKKMKN